MPITRPSEQFSFDEMEREVEEFELLLEHHGIKIRSRGPLEHELLVLHRVCTESASASRKGAWPELRDDLQHALGTWNIVKLILLNKSNPELAGIIPHLELLNKGSMVQTRPAIDDASNRLFELFIALGVLRVGTQTKLDHPQKPRGKNPDLVGRMVDNQLWGFACKVPYSKDPSKLFYHVKKGMQQIEKSPANTGIVVISLKNYLPHDKLFPQYGVDSAGNVILGSHDDYVPIHQLVHRYCRERVAEMIEHITPDLVLPAIQKKKAIRGVLFVGSVGTSVRTQHGRPPTLLTLVCPIPLTHKNWLRLPNPFEGRNRWLFERLNEGLQPAAPPLILLPPSYQ